MRSKFFDHRENGESMAELEFSAARSLTATGYVFEVLMPWANLGSEPAPGAEAGFQIYVNDSDVRDQWDWYRALWYPRDAAHMYPGNMHRLRLAEEAGPPVEVVYSAGLDGTRLRLDLAGVPELAGARVSLMSGDRMAAETAFERDATRASATVELPLLSEDEPYGTLSAVAEGREIARIELPDPRQLAARELMQMKVICDPHVFTGVELPPCGPERPTRVEGLAGRFGVRTRYFDSGFREVTAAERPGRYGAVVEIDTEHSGVLRRYRTLFRQPEPVSWWRGERRGRVGAAPRSARDRSRNRGAPCRFHRRVRQVAVRREPEGGCPRRRPAGRPLRRGPGRGRTGRAWQRRRGKGPAVVGGPEAPAAGRGNRRRRTVRLSPPARR